MSMVFVIYTLFNFSVNPIFLVQISFVLNKAIF